jgi:heptose I phosphotransferase
VSDCTEQLCWQSAGWSGPSAGSFWRRLRHGSRWTWIDERFRAALPADLDARVMSLESRDRYHAKQGRSTARVVFHAPAGPLPVYLKRHFRLPWRNRLAALFDPAGGHTPGAAEWRHLERVRALGIAVPEVVAAGERIGPWARLQSFLMVADLVDSQPLHEAIPALRFQLDPVTFGAWKRAVIGAVAAITATLHRACLFHKDFYLCHFFVDTQRSERAAAGTTPGALGLTLIDLHRLGHHPLRAGRWRRKDLGQLLFSTYGVAGIDDRDRLRFWIHYRRAAGLQRPRGQVRSIVFKAARYQAHNAKQSVSTTPEP